MSAIVVHPAGESTDWLHLVEAEYREMPGLQLTLPQVRRMWGLDDRACRDLLQELVAAHVLRVTANDQYVLDAPSERARRSGSVRL